MLRLACPHCGTRDEVEFHCGGDSHVERPKPDVSDTEWADYLFNRDNPKGLHFERWCHVFGCGQWFNVARYTFTHEIHGVYRMGEAAPEIDQ
jgi:sarcosine oxidase subunit delta